MNDKERDEGNDILKQSLQFYKDQEIKIHITSTNGRFYNGIILELQGDMLILDDQILGAMPINFIEIKVLERFKK